MKLLINYVLANAICVLVDDIGDTFGTLTSAAKILKNNGAIIVIAAITHGIFSGKAFENLAEPYIDKVYVTNTLPQSENISRSTQVIDEHRPDVGKVGDGHRQDVGKVGDGHRQDVGKVGDGHRQDVGKVGDGHRQNVSKIRVVDISNICAQAIMTCVNATSMSALFK